MKKHQQILLPVLFFVFFMVVVDEAAAAAAAAADADADAQPVQVATQMQRQRQQSRMMVSTRSLLQASPKIDCPSTCLVRCGNNWKNEMCHKMCNVCCNRCSCVPPGTGQDTRHLCPCYDTMVNPHTGKLKCP